MARDYRAIEEEFIADLKSRSGRTLAEWMAAIDALGLRDRDQIIDWLHPQGFTFEHASWLERIHNNGGRPIYGDALPDRRVEPRAAPKAMPPATPGPAAPSTSGPARPVKPPVAPKPGTAADADQLQALLGRGKAFRMLAEHVIAEARRAVPAVQIAARGDLIAIEHPAELGVLLVTPREVRLGLALGDDPVSAPWVKPKGLGAGAHITHMLVLTDARQVDDALLELLRRADQFVNAER